MKIIIYSLCCLLLLSCESVVPKDGIDAIALVKPSKDCYLVLNGKDWGGLSSANYSEITLTKGTNVLEFKHTQDGVVLIEKLVNSYDDRQQVVKIELPSSSQEKVEPTGIAEEENNTSRIESENEKAIASKSKEPDMTPSFPKETKPYYSMSRRKVIQKCEHYKAGNVSWNDKGKAVVKICIDEKGKVVSAAFVRRKSTITSQALINLVVGCAKEYRYEHAPGAPNTCGEITIRLGIH